MKHLSWWAASFAAICLLTCLSDTGETRGVGGGGRGGGGGGGGRPSGGFSGGGARPGGGNVGGGGSRGSLGSAPSFSRPSTPASRPNFNAGAAGGANRLPATSRPSFKPDTQPGLSRPSQLPAVGNNRPNINRPNNNLPNVNRPNINRPDLAGPFDRPNHDLPNVNRPNLPNRPNGDRPNFLPGLGGNGNRPNLGNDRWQQIHDNHPNWVNDRHQDLHDRLAGRTDAIHDWRNSPQDFWDNRRNDWNQRLADRYPWHDDWHHGYWHGDNHHYWEHYWHDHPVWAAFGLTYWGWNSASYLFGLGNYYNPYYVASPGVVYDYSQPIVEYQQPLAADPNAAVADYPPGVTQPGLDEFDQARAVFSQGDYRQALDLADKALKQMPGDALLHEFRGLCLFALGDYQQAAATLNAVLAVGPGWDWTTLSSMYPSTDLYTAQLRKLEDYVSAHPNDAASRFVLAYEYMTMGYSDPAAAQFAKVAQLVPNDGVSRQLADMLGYKGTDDSTAPDVQTEPVSTGPQLNVDQLLGAWRASGPGGATFDLTLTKDNQFTWKYSQGKKQETVSGAFAVDGDNLAMEPEQGGVMLAQITAPTRTGFNFKMVGAKDTDPPLKFVR
ncbi:MAG TPA: tetratricopeptide repeat protein [Pirellulales bacterium]|jgi:hypothetical protein|nr:tetratricopeptide repeat protein [Pirellulales bacterium]